MPFTLLLVSTQMSPSIGMMLRIPVPFILLGFSSDMTSLIGLSLSSHRVAMGPNFVRAGGATCSSGFTIQLSVAYIPLNKQETHTCYTPKGLTVRDPCPSIPRLC
jgi:hypothetical protein